MTSACRWRSGRPGREPDAHARRAANDAMDAVDRALAELHALRSRLLSEVRASDDQAAARVDALLARTRDGPRGSIPGAAAESPEPFAEVNASAATILGQRGDNGRAPHQEAP